MRLLFAPFSAVINWRRKLKEQLYKEEKAPHKIEEVEPDVENVEEELVDNSLKRKKKKILKERRKLNERMNLKMVIKGDQLVEDDDELFRLSKLTNMRTVENFEEFSMSEAESDTDEPATTKRIVAYDREERDYLPDSDEEKEDNVLENVDSELSEHSDEEGNDDDEVSEGKGLITDLGTSLPRNKQQELFFEKGIFQEEKLDGSDDDEVALGLDDDDEPVGKSRRKTKLTHSDSDDESVSDSDHESDYSDSDDDEKPRKKHPKLQADIKLDPESLALAEKIVSSRKAKHDLIDDAWNRYMRPPDESLPSWFRKDEQQHCFKPVDVDQSAVNYYRDKTKGVDVRPIKKVAEAKARKKKRALAKLEKAKKRAEAITDAPDMTEREKAAHLRR